MTRHLRTVLLAPIFVAALLLRLPLGALGATAPEAADTNAAATNQTAEAPDTNSVNAQTEESQDKASAKGRGGVNREAMVIIGKDAELKASDTAQVVVVIGGSAKIHGKVTESVTVIGGEADIDGDVADEVVAVMGGITLHKGARVGGDVVAVGGKVQQDEGATIGGHVQEVDLGAIGLPAPRWLQKWFRHCVLLVRPLSLSVG